MIRSRRAQLLIGMLVSLLLLAWVFRQTDWAEVGQRLREADPLLLFLGFVAVAVGVPLRAWRWRTMLAAEAREAPFGTVLDAVSIGYLANNILPARLGDILRTYLVSQWARVGLPFALSTTAVERVLDTLVVVLMLFGVLPFLPVPPAAARAGSLMGALILVGGVALVVAAWHRERSARLIRALLRPLPLNEETWGERLTALLDGFALVRRPLLFGRMLLLTALIWAVAIAGYWVTFRAFGLADLGPLEGAFTISLAALGMALPSGPANAGTFDGAATGALTLLGVADTLAGGLAIMLHAQNFIAITLVGLWAMARRGLSLASLSQESSRAEASVREERGPADGLSG